MSSQEQSIGITEGTCYNPGQLMALARGAGEEFLVEGLIAKGALILLGGESKSGKSVLCTNLALAVARGEPWLGRNVSQGTVAWCCYEESLGERAFVFNAYPDVEDVPLLSVWPPEDRFIDDPSDGIDWLRRLVVGTNASLLVVDPLVAACGGGEFDEMGEGRSRLKPLRALCIETGVTAIVIHHLNKDTRQGRTNRNRLAGSHQLMAAASADWTMHTEIAADACRIIDVSYHARRYGCGEFRVRSTGPSSFTLVTQEDHSKALVHLTRILAGRVGDNVTRREIESLAQVSPSTAGEYVKLLVSHGVLRHNGQRGPKQGYVVLEPTG